MSKIRSFYDANKGKKFRFGNNLEGTIVGYQRGFKGYLILGNNKGPAKGYPSWSSTMLDNKDTIEIDGFTYFNYTRPNDLTDIKGKSGQQERLLDALKRGQEVNRITAMQDLGIMELSARICDLEKQGYEITKGWIQLVNRFGEEYKLRTYKL